MRKVVLYIAMSIDGYVADMSGAVDWLGGDNSDIDASGSYPEFIRTVDTVILGWKTYHQIVTELSPDEWAYSGMQSYVMTHKKINATNDIVFTDTAIDELIASLHNQEGKDVWICGGADIVNQCRRLDLIDRYVITVIPTLLGGGVRLFEENISERKLKLISTTSYNGMTDLIYERRI